MMNRLLYTLLMSLCLASPGWAAMAFQESQSNSADTPGIATHALPAANVAAGSYVIACFKWESAVTLDSITGGDTMTLLDEQSHSGALMHVRCGHVLSASANASYVQTATFSGNVEYIQGGIFEFTYSGTASLDAQIGSTESDFDDTPSSNTLTTTGTDEVCVAIHGDGNPQTFSAQTINGVAQDGGVTQSSMDMFYRILTATFSGGDSSLTRTSYSPSRWIQRLTCVKVEASGGSGVSGFRRRLQQ